MGAKKRSRTETSDFGTSGRRSHDATRFYESRLYQGLDRTNLPPSHDQPTASVPVNRLFCKSSETMEELPDGCVHLMITSPPYNVTKEYDADLTLDEYRAFLRRVFGEVFRVLVNGGRACVNIANVGRKPYLPMHAFIAQDMIAMGFAMRGEVIWNKSSSAGPSTAWGSWQSASNPTLRDVHEYILIFSKGDFTRKEHTGRNTISRDEFLEFTKSVWSFPAESARRVGHPAPFPLELPRRLIHLYSFEQDLVLDPFAGSGTTCLAAVQTGRHYIGYERHRPYVELAEQRIARWAPAKAE